MEHVKGQGNRGRRSEDAEGDMAGERGDVKGSRKASHTKTGSREVRVSTKQVPIISKVGLNSDLDSLSQLPSPPFINRPSHPRQTTTTAHSLVT
jgi:hypothetical protein